MFFLIPFQNIIARFAESTKRSLQREIQADVLNVALKILVGVILTAVIITSLGAIGRQVNAVLLTQENGTLLSIIGLILIAATCGILLAITLRPKTKKTMPTSSSVDLEQIALTFTQGIIDGFNNRQRPPRSLRRPIH